MIQDSFLKSFRETKSPFITNPYRFAEAEAPAGGWVELGRTTTGSALSDFSVGSLADKRYYMILTNISGKSNSGVNWQTRMGNGSIDTGSNYAMRYSLNGTTDSTGTGAASIQSGTNPTDKPQFSVAYISNLSGKEKLYMSHDVNQETAGAGNAPERGEYTGKWTNTSNPLDIIGSTTSSSHTMSSGSEMVVLGWDPADDHTTNFWEELASTTLTSDTTGSWGVTSFTPKKYLWVQMWGRASTDTQLRFGTGGTTDTGTSYAARMSGNGGSDTLDTNATHTQLGAFINSNRGYANMFIINNSANEKLVIQHDINSATGASNAPSRYEKVGKWTNTSGQIDTIKFEHSSATWYAGCTMKVWGSN
jgi:hypothetical protein